MANMFKCGGGENVTVEVNEQTSTIENIIESLVGKLSGANATASDILKGKKAYVGQNLVTGELVPLSVKIDGHKYQGDSLDLKSVECWISDIELPYKVNGAKAVTLNNEIHLLGGTGSYTNHYKFNGSTWSSVSTIPFSFYNGCAVVYNNEIHILGGSSSTNSHYKWNGSTWTSVSKTPYYFYNGSAVVYNNEIHILGTSDSSYWQRHYKWNGSSWVSVSSLPYSFRGGTTVIYNGEIHIMGSSSSNHYKWNGSSWTSVSTLPKATSNSQAVVIGNEIRLLSLTDIPNAQCSFDGSTWKVIDPLPLSQFYGTSAFLNDKLHLMGGAISGTSGYDGTKYHYRLDDSYVLA